MEELNSVFVFIDQLTSKDGFWSLVLFIVELGMLIYVIKTANQFEHIRAVVGILLLLQIYQLMEFMICIGIKENIVGRLAFVSITFLPPSGHFLTRKLTGSSRRDYLLSFALGIGFAVFYGIIPNSIDLVDCNTYYAIYTYKGSNLYALFYYGVILQSLLILVNHIYNNNDHRMELYLLLGYLLFLVPMIILLVFDFSFANPIPSIMCKFALFLAINLTLISTYGS